MLLKGMMKMYNFVVGKYGSGKTYFILEGYLKLGEDSLFICYHHSYMLMIYDMLQDMVGKENVVFDRKNNELTIFGEQKMKFIVLNDDLKFKLLGLRGYPIGIIHVPKLKDLTYVLALTEGRFKKTFVELEPVGDNWFITNIDLEDNEFIHNDHKEHSNYVYDARREYIKNEFWGIKKQEG